MNITEIRLANLTAIIKDDFGDVKASLAKKMGVPPSNLNRYYSENARDRRKISDEAARAIERAAGKPDGWLDKEHDEPAHFEKMKEIMSSLKEDDQLHMVELALVFAAQAKARHGK